MQRNKTAILTLAFATATVLAGCSGGTSDNEQSGAPTVSESATQSSSETASPTASETSTSAPASSSAASPTGSQGQGTDLAEAHFDTTWQEALDIAKENFSGDVSKIELEPNDAGRYSYKIELISDKEEYSAHIDANSGELITEDLDDLDSDEQGTERQEKRIDLDKVVSLDKAMDTARAEQSGPVTKWKLEGEATGPQYEFDINREGAQGDREVHVDAMSGKILPGED